MCNCCCLRQIKVRLVIYIFGYNETKNGNTTVSERFQNLAEITFKESKSISLAHICMHDVSISWHDTYTSIKVDGRGKLVL